MELSRGEKQRTRASMGLRTRARTQGFRSITKRELAAGRVHLSLVDETGRPLTRGDCIDGQRPCPWVGCSQNLYLDVTDADGIKFNFPDLEPDQVPPEKSCALDVADQGGATLEDVATTMNIVRERVRQIEAKAFSRVRHRARTKGAGAALLREYSDTRDEDLAVGAGSVGPIGGSAFAQRPERTEPDEIDDADEPPTRISFFAEPENERFDELVSTSVWNMFARWQNGRGFDCRSTRQKAQSKHQAEKRKAQGIVPKAPRNIEEETMTKDEFAAAHGTFKKAHGRTPTATELFEAIGPEAKSVSNVRQSIKRAGLTLTGGRGPATLTPKPSKAPVRKSAPPPVNRRKPVAEEAKPSRSTSRDPTVAALIAKRDAFRTRADALDVAIEALSVVL